MSDTILATILICTTLVIMTLITMSQLVQIKKYEASAKALENADKISKSIKNLENK